MTHDFKVHIEKLAQMIELTETQLAVQLQNGEIMRSALIKIRHIQDAIPFDGPAAATECIRIAKEALRL